MRWLFLSNLIRDAIDIQTLPYNPPVTSVTNIHPPRHHNYHDVPTHSTYHQAPQHSQYQHHSSPPSVSSLSTATSVSCEDEWRDHCMRGIASYPPGTQRLLILDAMRAELVEQLSWSLQQADQTVEEYETWRRRERELEWRKSQQKSKEQKAFSSSAPTETDCCSDDPYMDADIEILKSFEKETTSNSDVEENDNPSSVEATIEATTEEKQAVLVISNNGTVKTDEMTQDSTLASPSFGEFSDDCHGDDIISQNSAEQAEDAQKTIRVVRDYLPQLVSVVLNSPPAFDPNLIDPVDKLRQIILRRCVEDANWGVDMCWLLEAEVGRAWKTLFEHRQQTGRRLIVVLPAEKAAVLAKIGSSKKEAFDLLQDAEQATAFGYTIPMDEDLFYHGPHYFNQQQHRGQHHQKSDPARLPSSLSLRRCSHFGDTMHFIDRLTKVSLDLRRVSSLHREAYLQDCLREMNRRVRRRMVTRGDVSLDVEDHRGPDDWPLITDITADMLRYSVHLPVDPKQNKRWPGGVPATDVTSPGAVRVLNIVVEESRILASRERCPYLVHLEVAETGLRGSDSRLYASGAPGIGATIEEALALTAQASSICASSDANMGALAYGNYHIPSELLSSSSVNPTRMSSRRENSTTTEDAAPSNRMTMPRGGWQAHEAFYNPEDFFDANPYDSVRQNEYKQLHEEMHNEVGMMEQPAEQRSQFLSTREVLLDKVFGQPWAEKCEEIRQASPYGKVHGWRLASFIVKAGEDIRREALVMQIITKLNEWFTEEIPEADRPSMRPYTIMCVGGDAGVVECLSDAKSVDELKKRTDNFVSLRDYFERAYGPPTMYNGHYGGVNPSAITGEEIPTFEKAQDNFLRSLVGYSVVCYILQIKDRHNANILMDRQGHIMHIDFGYVLGDTPKMGKVPIFSERAPFKLSGEFWDVLGGFKKGGLGVRFLVMFQRALECASAHTEEIESLVEATMLTLTRSPRQARNLAAGVKNRLRLRGGPGSKELQAFVIELVNAALTSWGTTTYDWLQRNMNGYE
ncbi:phosphatidylinositol 3- and 4-kinase [Nitzschia inconspicua]|uniref:Phosphatidylinositol 3- and 4-kinase n=1 Tax=Nitzschia inconspicua TaxID=303405 RepID=A0A9K3L6G2_9STRA|nr:phosphatidylinositol 3- and 4-kinase [Nitzschia inconspicua]